MAVETNRLFYEEFLQLPETKRRYEVIDGGLRYMPPAPTPVLPGLQLRVDGLG